MTSTDVWSSCSTHRVLHGALASRMLLHLREVIGAHAPETKPSTAATAVTTTSSTWVDQSRGIRQTSTMDINDSVGIFSRGRADEERVERTAEEHIEMAIM
ncbi:hypothetical protein EW146_g2911 [Bondarzewia mesenterica]|uniref:Uncharacterized protein n=1 Tax=Bondarzewia mesenterica TaxID=1095465 RepID=A0A4S4M105_9AGAM|nr:hypothetical protein EW146_g2911 [Bondarzewia mesenterica]